MHYLSILALGLKDQRVGKDSAGHLDRELHICLLSKWQMPFDVVYSPFVLFETYKVLI